MKLSEMDATTLLQVQSVGVNIPGITSDSHLPSTLTDFKLSTWKIALLAFGGLFLLAKIAE
jgi:hypothetical protein